MKIMSIPINKEAMIRMDYDENVDGDVFEMHLDSCDYDFFCKTGIVNKLNSALNINIDDYEDEKILGLDDLLKARKIVTSELGSDVNGVLDKILSQINKAIENNTGIFFYF